MLTKPPHIRPLASFPPKCHVHMIGIGGCGMSPLAHLLIQQGHTVSGSDVVDSSVITLLRSEGALISIPHDVENVTSPNVVVYSSAIAPTNAEIVSAKNKNIPVIPRSRLLADLMTRKHGIIVAGSHGKTSTTGMIFWALQNLGTHPSLIFGGKFQQENISARLGEGELIVVESDESDGSFLMLNPAIAVLTNIDQEHVKTYGSFENLVSAFHDFANRPPFFGFSVISADCPYSRALFAKLGNRKYSFGFSKDADFHIEVASPPVNINWAKQMGAQSRHPEPKAKDLDMSRRDPSPSAQDDIPGVTILEKDGTTCTRVHFPLQGEHSALNMAAAFATLRGLGFSPESLQTAFSDFPGVHRRMEKTSGSSSIEVWDDYAHHPTEIEAVVRCIQRTKPQGAPLIMVFQPHRYSRFLSHIDAFATVLSPCDHVVLMPVYGASEMKPDGFDEAWQSFVENLRQKKIPVTLIPETNYIGATVEALTQVVTSPAAVLFCGAGNVTAAAHQFGAWAQT